jgi:hypothetical protein
MDDWRPPMIRFFSLSLAVVFALACAETPAETRVQLVDVQGAPGAAVFAIDSELGPRIIRSETGDEGPEFHVFDGAGTLLGTITRGTDSAQLEWCGRLAAHVEHAGPATPALTDEDLMPLVVEVLEQLPEVFGEGTLGDPDGPEPCAHRCPAEGACQTVCVESGI